MRSRRRTVDGEARGGRRPAADEGFVARRGRRRRQLNGGRDYFELRAGDERPKEDPKEEKSIALVVLFFVMVVVAVCVAIILRSMEVETFPGL